MTRVTLAYRFELDLNNRQRTLAAQHAGLARKAFNWALETRNEHYRNVVLPARERGEKIRPLSCYDLQKAWVAQKPAGPTRSRPGLRCRPSRTSTLRSRGF